MDTYKGMHNPMHPGEVLREGYLKPLKLTQDKLAKALGVSRKAVSQLVNGYTSLTPEMALRIGLVFGENPETWLRMQANYDAWQVHQRAKEIRRQVTPIKLVAA